MKRPATHDSESSQRPLREFFYLDEVSVQSLASAVGQALMVGRVETVESSTTKSRKFGLRGKAGPAGANLMLGREQARADGSQVEAKYNIQATFAQLKEVLGTHAGIGIERRDEAGSDDIAKSVAPSLRDALRLDGVATPVAELDRGAIVELRAKISAHQMFTLASLAESLRGIATDSPGIFGDAGRLQHFTDGANILNHMLGGLVPIEGRVTSHKTVEFADGTWVIPSEEVEHFSEALTVRDLFVVGVMERGLFWRDPRRVLFEDLEYTIFGRATHDGLRSSWMPSKWFGPMNGMMAPFIEEIAQIDFPQTATEDVGLRQALSNYVEAIAEEFGLTTCPLDTADFVLSDADSLEEHLSLFDMVAHRSFGDQLAEVDLDDLAQVRESVLQDAGLLLPTEGNVQLPSSAQIPMKGPMIELDFVAGYW